MPPFGPFIPILLRPMSEGKKKEKDKREGERGKRVTWCDTTISITNVLPKCEKRKTKWKRESIYSLDSKMAREEKRRKYSQRALSQRNGGNASMRKNGENTQKKEESFRVISHVFYDSSMSTSSI